MRILAAVLALALPALAQGHHRTENKALLGIVAVPKRSKSKRPDIVVAHVLKKSPGDRAGLKAGDELASIAGTDIEKPEDVDAALAKFEGGEKIEILYRRDGKKQKAEAKLIERGDYRGDFLKPQRRGATDFDAPEWFVYAWAQAGKEPPTLESTKGKVVVIHCFQSW